MPGRVFSSAHTPVAPAVPTTKVSVKHDPRQSVKVYLNDRPLSPLNFDAMALNADRSIAVSRWKGVDLRDGNNRLRVVV